MTKSPSSPPTEAVPRTSGPAGGPLMETCRRSPAMFSGCSPNDSPVGTAVGEAWSGPGLEPVIFTRGSVGSSRTSTVTDASRGPAPVGVKTTSAVQLPPAAISLFRQVVAVTTNSELLGPPFAKPSRWTGVPPWFRAVIVRDSLGWLSATAEKDRLLLSSATSASDPPDRRMATPARGARRRAAPRDAPPRHERSDGDPRDPRGEHRPRGHALPHARMHPGGARVAPGRARLRTGGTRIHTRRVGGGRTAVVLVAP